MHAAELELLLSEDAWMRRLAAGLAGNSGEGDDLVQEVWSAALAGGQRPQRELRSPRAWLGSVLRKLQLQSRRTRSRREQRERAVARVEAQPGADELVEQLSLRKELAAALLALDEPYRGALYLRFYQDCELKELAARQGVPVSTAHARVQRGLELLRTRLEREHGGERGAWIIGLARLARSPGVALKVGSGGMLMGTAMKVAVSLCVIAGALTFVTNRVGGERRWLAGGETPRAAATAEPIALAASTARAQREAPEQVTSIPISARVAAASPAVVIRGRVVGLHDEPLGGVRVGLRVGLLGYLEAPVATSDAAGSFELALPDEREAVPGALDPARAMIASELVDGAWRIVLSDTADYSGKVVDAAGAPLAGAELCVDLPQSFFRERGLQRPPASRPERATTRSDSSGAFALSGVPAGPAAALFARASGFAPQIRGLPAGGATDLLVQLVQDKAGVPLTGIVLDPAGHPVAGARVSAGTEIVESREDGTFALRWLPGEGESISYPNGASEDRSTTHIAAVQAGFGPARLELATLDVGAPIVLALRESLAIRGRVLDPAGNGRARIALWVEDPTFLGLEADASGGRISSPRDLESSSRGGRCAATDEDGAFVLDSLLPRTYRVIAYDPRTAEFGGPWSLEAGASAAALTFDDEPGTSLVAGTLVTASGTPLAGAVVCVQRESPRASTRPYLPALPEGTEQRLCTDAQGRFAFAKLATQGTRLEFFHEAIFMLDFALADAPDMTELTVVAPVLCRLQIVLTDPGCASNARILDAGGNELRAFYSEAASVSMTAAIRFAEGKSDVVRVPETARTLVLRRRDGQEVLRLPIRPDPDRLTVVQP